MCHFPLGAAPTRAAQSGSEQPAAARAALVTAAGSASAVVAGSQRADPAAIAVSAVAASADHHQDAASGATELAGGRLGGLGGGDLRLDGRLPATANNLPAALVSATRLTRRPTRQGRQLRGQSPLSFAGRRRALASRLYGDRRAAYAAAWRAPRKRTASSGSRGSALARPRVRSISCGPVRDPPIAINKFPTRRLQLPTRT